MRITRHTTRLLVFLLAAMLVIACAEDEAGAQAADIGGADTATPVDGDQPDTVVPDDATGDAEPPGDARDGAEPDDTGEDPDVGAPDTADAGDDATDPPPVAYDPIPGQWSDDFTFAPPGLYQPLGPRAWAALLLGDDVIVAGMFEQVGEVTASNVARWNGVDWHPLGAGVPIAVHALAADPEGNLYAAGRYQGGGFGIGGPGGIYRWDGTEWTAIGWHDQFEQVNALAWLGGALYAGGDMTAITAADQQDSTPVQSLARWNGTEWQALPAGPEGSISTLVVHGGSLCAGGLFQLTGGLGDNVACLTAGTWSVLGEGLNGGVNVLRSTTAGLVAGGYFSHGTPETEGFSIGLARLEEGAWQPLAGGVLGGAITAVFALAQAPTGELYVGGTFTGVDGDAPKPAGNIAKLSGKTWIPLGTGVSNEVGVVLGSEIGIRTLLLTGDALIAGGLFSTAGEATALNVARWADDAWSAMVDTMGRYLGVPGVINSLSRAPDGSIVVGGFFDSAGGTTTPNVARLKGAEWHSLGEGLDGIVWAVHAAQDDTVYAGGQFPGGIRRFQNDNWVTLGGDANGDARAFFEMEDGTILIGGEFTSIGNTAAANVARWTGEAIEPLGSGLDGRVNAVTAGPDGTIYAGGFFEATGSGAPVSRVARFDGSAWQDIGGGVNGFVRDLAFWGEKLVVAGQFETAGETTVSSVAIWDGDAWSAVGTGSEFLYDWGTGLQLTSLAVQPNGFFVGVASLDVTIQGETYNGIAWWDGEQWAPLDVGIGDVAEDVLLDGPSVWVGGGFTTAGGLISLGLARWDYDDQ